MSIFDLFRKDDSSAVMKAKNEGEAKITHDVESYGWSIMNVFDPENKAPSFSYSIGMFKTLNSPEILIYGMDRDDAGRTINAIGEFIRSGKKFDPRQTYHEFIEPPFVCTFIPIDRQNYKDHLGFDIGFYNGEDFPALQCFWSDEKGKFPWDADFNETIKHLQPILGHVQKN